jgi:hypothetical protein
MTIRDILNSKASRDILMVSASIVVLIFVFSAGVFVGIEKAKFSYGWGESYYSNFAGPSQPSPLAGQNPFWDKNYISPHGVLGKIIEIDADGFVMTGNNQAEMPIQVGKQTIIKNHRDTLKFTDFKIGDQVIVIGQPGGQGEINATFIRINNSQTH